MPQRHNVGKGEYSASGLTYASDGGHHAAMAKGKHYLREWRKFRGLSQVDLAALVGVTQGQYSKVETFKKPYDQDFLESAAEALGCSVLDILSRRPTDQPTIWSLWTDLEPAEREAAADAAIRFRKAR